MKKPRSGGPRPPGSARATTAVDLLSARLEELRATFRRRVDDLLRDLHHLVLGRPRSRDPLDPKEHGHAVERSCTLGDRQTSGRDKAGLFHGWSVSVFVRIAKRFKADIRVSFAGDAQKSGPGRIASVDAKSIFGVSCFSGARPGDRFLLRAKGPDAEKAVQELGDALENRGRF